MRFVSFEYRSSGGGAGPRPGLALADGRILDLMLAGDTAGDPLEGGGVVALIAGGSPVLERIGGWAADGGLLRAAAVGAEAVRLLAPIPRPLKNVFCVGRNYADHVAEGARAMQEERLLPKVPQFFTKPPTAVVGPDAEVRIREEVSRRLDYEVELGVVIGRPGVDIAAEEAMDHVFGYTIINDVTARDLQKLHERWLKGKGLDTSCPMGPWIVTKDEIPDYRALELRCLVNGEERQRARASEMIFDVPALIASLSSGLTLEPGDVIATGTPAGVGFAMDPPRYLGEGDEVVCEIDGIGRLANRIARR